MRMDRLVAKLLRGQLSIRTKKPAKADHPSSLEEPYELSNVTCGVAFLLLVEEYGRDDNLKGRWVVCQYVTLHSQRHRNPPP